MNIRPFSDLTAFETVFLLLLTVILAAVFVYLIVLFFGRGRKVRIKVTDKWRSVIDSYNTNRARTTPSEHYMIKCVYPDSARPKKKHTLNCEEYSVWKALKKGKEYTVTLKFLHITKIHPKKHTGKKK